MTIKVEEIDGINEHETNFLYDEIFAEASYLPADIEIGDGAVVFDVGANIGMYSLFVASVCPTASIYAFEPLPPVFEKLRSNTTTHSVPARLFPFGLSDAERELAFVFYPGYSTMSAQGSYANTEAERDYIRARVLQDEGPQDTEDLEALDDLLDYRLEETSHACRVRRLSDVIDEELVERIDMLKIDVQRAELDVLRGLDDRHWPLVRQIAMEVHDEAGTPTEGNLGRVLTMLGTRGFRTRVEPDERVPGAGRHALFAVRPR